MVSFHCTDCEGKKYSSQKCISFKWAIINSWWMLLAWNCQSLYNKFEIFSMSLIKYEIFSNKWGYFNTMWWKQYLFHQCAQWNDRWLSTILIPKLFRSLHSWLFKFVAFWWLEKITWHGGCPWSEGFFWRFSITNNPTSFQFSGCIICFCPVIILR